MEIRWTTEEYCASWTKMTEDKSCLPGIHTAHIKCLEPESKAAEVMSRLALIPLMWSILSPLVCPRIVEYTQTIALFLPLDPDSVKVFPSSIALPIFQSSFFSPIIVLSGSSLNGVCLDWRRFATFALRMALLISSLSRRVSVPSFP